MIKDFDHVSTVVFGVGGSEGPSEVVDDNDTDTANGAGCTKWLVLLSSTLCLCCAADMLFSALALLAAR